MVVEYFTKWIEAEVVAKINETEVMNFLWKNIVCRFELPRIFISNHRTQFQGKKVMEWCKEMKIQQNFTSIGHAQANGQTELANRILLQHLKTRLEEYKPYWVDELPGVLWAYYTTPWSSIGETPFCLVYGSKAIILIEIGEATHWVRRYGKDINDEAMSCNLEVIREKRESAQMQIIKLETEWSMITTKKPKIIISK